MISDTTLYSICEYAKSSGEYTTLGPDNLRENYRWPFPDWPDFFLLKPCGQNQYEKNVWLKKNSSELWHSSNHLQSAQWIVADWGGVRGNKSATIEQYVHEIENGNYPTGLKGVASYSKILAFMDPHKFAIFDARVSAALNCIQLLDNTQNPIFFPHLAGRNKLLNAFQKHPKFTKARLTRDGWSVAHPELVYDNYLSLLHAVCAEINTFQLYEIEMSLFADAETLILKVANKSNVSL